jgi:hypothetical protein
MTTTFGRIKTVTEIVSQCRAQGVPVETAKHLRGQSDFIMVGRPESDFGHALYNSFNGKFFGVTDLGQRFSSEDRALDAQPWFQALLAFFYADPEPPQ